MIALQIPEDLADMAQQVPGLNERVARFVRLEVEQYRQRQARFSAESLALVERAKERARARQGKARDKAVAVRRLYRLRTHPGGFLPGIDGDKIGQLADEL